MTTRKIGFNSTITFNGDTATITGFGDAYTIPAKGETALEVFGTSATLYTPDGDVFGNAVELTKIFENIA